VTRLECLRRIVDDAGGAAPARAALVALAGLFAFLLAWSPWGLWEPDEGRYADVAATMIARGDLVTPRIDGAVFLDKPPLVYWVTAASLAAWGHGETGARFGQALFAAGLLWAAFEIAWLLYGNRRAALALLVLGSSVGLFTAGHYLNLDLGLAFFVTLTMLCFLRGHRAGAGGTGWYLGMFAAAAGGVLVKGPVAVVLAGMAAAVFLVLRGRLATLRHVPWMRGILLFLVLAAPWFIAVSLANPEFPSYFFLHENLARFSTGVHHRGGAWYYYLVVVAFGLLPWTPALIPAALRWRPGPDGMARRLRAEAPAFLLSWVVPTLLFFSLSRSKLPGYVLPAFPGIAIAAAALVDGALSRARTLRGLFLWPVVTPGVFALAFAAYWRVHHHQWHEVIDSAAVVRLVVAAVGLAALAQAAGLILARRGRVLAGVAVTAFGWCAVWWLALAGTGRAGAFNATRPLAAAIAAEAPGSAPVYTFRCELRGLPFYLGRTVGIVDSNDDDTEIGRLHGDAPGTFPSVDDLAARLRGSDRIFVVLRAEDLPALEVLAGGPLHRLAAGARLVLVSNATGPGAAAALDPRR
jgi:4-amino-4-deoxy-L-arabinose transferase-like glycosyltransferase